MNKRHWVSVTLNAGISDEGLLELAEESYDLIVLKLTKKDKEKLENILNAD